MNHIKELRKEKGFSRTELSKISGVPARTIDDWENNRRKPRDVYQLKKVADSLEVKIEDLIDWEKESRSI